MHLITFGVLEMRIPSLLATGLFLISSTSFAHVKVSTGPLAIDQNSVKFVGACSDADSLADFNEDGSFDLIFNNLVATAQGGRDAKTCMVKFNAKLPKGYTIAVSRVAVGGLSVINSENGKTTATLRHTLAGAVGDAAIASYAFVPGSEVQDVTLEKDFGLKTTSYLPCGADLTFKSTISLAAWGDDAEISINEGAQSSKQYNVRYYWSWKKCN
jgi:hypothetical protein